MSPAAPTAFFATKDIRGIADLKGRSVAVLHGSVSHFYLNVLLTEAGLTQADLEIMDLSAEDAGEAFMMQEVDAAVTWEPWLTQGRTTDYGHLLTDSSERPGLIVDGLLTRADVFAARRDDFRAVARAWDAAVGYVETNPDDATAIMARHAGGWLEDPAVFAETLKGVRFFDAEQPGVLRHVGAPGPDLPDRPIRDRPLVERRDAENAAVAGRHDRPRHLGRVKLLQIVTPHKLQGGRE